MRRYVSVVTSGGRLKRSFHVAASSLSRHTPRFPRFVQQLTESRGLRNAVLVDQVKSSHVTRLQNSGIGAPVRSPGSNVLPDI